MYLDPGFGGMLLQVLVAIIAAGGVLIFSFRRKIKALFSKNKSPDKSDQPISPDTKSSDDLIDPLSGTNEDSKE